MPFDVAIIGGGPAGTAAAMTLRKRADITVALFDRGDYTSPKVGESLSAGTRSLLQYLGVWDRFQREQTLQLYGSQAAWGSDQLGSMDFIFTLHGAGWALDRQRFEIMLAEEAALCGASMFLRTRVQACAHDGQLWQIDTDKGPFQARFVIDAAGRTSGFSTAQGAVRLRHDDLTAIVARLPRKGANVQMTRVESFEQGWWYMAPIPSGETIVCLFSDAKLSHTCGFANPVIWRDRLLQTVHHAGLMSPGDALPTLAVLPAFSARLQLGANSGLPMIAAGDAVAARDPLSSSGIPNALGSGIQAARVAADHLFGGGQLRQGYLHSIAMDHDAYLRTHWKTYQVEKRWPSAPTCGLGARKGQLCRVDLCARPCIGMDPRHGPEPAITIGADHPGPPPLPKPT
jgi:flavin-dependent dehydrogenase